MTQELCFLLVDEFSEIGGAERILLSIAESLKNSGHSVFSVVPGDGSFTTLLQQLGVQVSFVDILGLKGNWLSASKWGEINCQFDMLLDQVRPDVILANSLWAAFTISHSAKKHQCRIVCCVHASIEPKSTLKKIAFPIIRKKLFKPISRWVTVSDNLAEQLFRMGVKRELLEVIPNGVDTDLFRPRTPHKEVRIALPFPENWHIVGTVGRLHPGKGQQVFLKAASIVVQKHPQTCFVIAGKEIVTPSENIHFRESLLELTARLNLTQNVYFAGFHTEVHHLMNCFNSFVSASFEESFGLSVLEAMSSGLPVVVSKVGGLKQLVVDGKNGFLFEAGDYQSCAERIIRLIENSEWCNNAGKAARETALAYDFDMMLERWLNALCRSL